MRYAVRHAWDVSVPEAIAIQDALRDEVVCEDQLRPVRYVAGVDVGFEQNNEVTRAAVVVLTFPALELHEQQLVRRPTGFPYVPGLLSFREVPALLDALEALETEPDLLLCDGQGRAHPRRFGLACHLGVLTGLPAIGVAKTRLVGQYEPVPEEKGAWRELRHGGDVVGAVLRSRTRVRPLFISVGHRISLKTALKYVLACTPKYRLPETTRLAHRLASDEK